MPKVKVTTHRTETTAHEFIVDIPEGVHPHDYINENYETYGDNLSHAFDETEIDEVGDGEIIAGEGEINLVELIEE